MTKLFFTVIIIISLFSCSKEKVEINNVVTAYNKMLAEALSKPDPRIMEYFTSPRELSRIDSYILYLRKDKKLILSELKELQFKDNVLSGDKKSATVNTNEQWTFRYLDHKTRQPVTDRKDITYENTYYLIKEGGRWVVDRVQIKEK